MDQLDRGLGKLRFGPRRELRLDDIAGHEHRTHPPPPGAADIGGDQPLLRSHQAHDRAMFAMAAQRADDCLGLDAHYCPLSPAGGGMG